MNNQILKKCVLKKRLIATVLCICGLALSIAPASAQDIGMYVTPKLSYNFQYPNDFKLHMGGGSQALNASYKGALGMGLAVGYDLNLHYAIPARVEAEGLYLAKVSNSGQIIPSSTTYSQKNSILGLFVNAYLDFHNSTIFTPYIGGGLGMAQVKSGGHVNGINAPNSNESNLAWNIAAGFATEINYNLKLDLGYRYANFGTARTGIAGGNYISSDVSAHQLSIGARFNF